MLRLGLFKTLDNKDWRSLPMSACSTSSSNADKEWLSLSISVGSSSSFYETKEQQRSKNTWNTQQESGGNINNVDLQEHERKRLSALKKWEMARGSPDENFISLSIPGSSSSSCDEEKMEQKKGNHASESSSNSMGSQELEKLRLLGLRKCEMLFETERGSNKEKWLSLSIPGSSSYYDDKEKKLKAKGSQNNRRSSCIINPEKGRQRTSNIKNLTASLETVGGLRKNSKVIIMDSSPSSQEEDEMKESNCHSSHSITTEEYLHCKKRKITQEIVDVSIANTKLRITESSSREKEEEEEKEEENRQRELYHKKGKQKVGEVSDNGSLYKGLPSTEAAEKGWLEVAFHMGVTVPELYLSKRVTRSDAKPEQHRFQLTQADIEKATQPLQQLAEQSRLNAVLAKVLDKKGNKHDLILKYLSSSHTYRFMGVGYTNFLNSSKLKENEFMSIWGRERMARGSRGIEGENWLAFVNSDKIIESIE